MLRAEGAVLRALEFFERQHWLDCLVCQEPCQNKWLARAVTMSQFWTVGLEAQQSCLPDAFLSPAAAHAWQLLYPTLGRLVVLATKPALMGATVRDAPHCTSVLVTVHSPLH